MARRATVLQETISQSDFSLILDAGGFSSGLGDESKLKTKYLFQGLEWLGYSVINLGVRDLMNGGESIKELQKAYDIKLLSSNIYYKDLKKQFIHSSTIEKIKTTTKSSPFTQLKIGILGLCDDREVLFSTKIQEEQLESRLPLEIAQKEISKLEKNSDLVILLYHGKYSIVEKIVKEVQGIDIVIMGGEYYRAEGSKIQNPIIVSTPNMGKYLGSLKLELDKNKQIISHVKSKTPLKEDVQEIDKYLKLAEEFEEKSRAIRQAKYSHRTTN